MKTADGQRADHRFAAAGNGHIAFIVDDGAERLAHGMGSSGAGGGEAEIGPPGAVNNRNLPGAHIGNNHGNEKGRDTLGSLFQSHLMVFFDGG